MHCPNVNIIFHMYKVIVFAPKSDIDRLIAAMGDAGAGKIGNYSHCAFVTKGQGTWVPLPGSHPKIGKVGTVSTEEQYKIEMVCPKTSLEHVTEAIRKHHSFETPEINIIDLT